MGAFGPYIYTASSLDEQISIYRVGSLELVDSVPLTDEGDFDATDDFMVVDDGLIVYDADQSTVSVYG